MITNIIILNLMKLPMGYNLKPYKHITYYTMTLLYKIAFLVITHIQV